jgi:hypothetical protein
MNALFIHIPKTAGMFIQGSLPMKHCRFPNRARRFDNTGLVTFGHMNPLLYASRRFLKTAYTFAFCRNPYDRAVSHYFYARKKHPNILNPSVSFVDWTRNLGNHGGKFRPQHTWIKGLRVDFVGRFESLNNDLSRVANTLGVDIKTIPPQNKTRHGPYREYYCKESKHNIEKYYAGDFKHFGYKHDDNLLHTQPA